MLIGENHMMIFFATLTVFDRKSFVGNIKKYSSI